MPQTLYIVRHGETDANAWEIMQGHRDVPLNQTGVRQAEKLVSFFVNIKIDAIYSSDLRRAFHTAQPLAASKNISITPSSYLRERSLGPYEGKRWPEVFASNPNFVRDAFYTETNDLGVEDNNSLANRIRLFTLDMYAKHHHQHLAIFTHGGTKRFMLKHLTGLDFDENISLPNTCISILEKTQPGKYLAKKIGITPHLQH